MKINTNIPALAAQRQMAQTTRALSRALARLSSGRRITEARDDAAGLAIGEGLNSQARGLRQIALNINQAFGYLNTADGILATQTELVQRMRELAIQGATGTLSTTDRKMLETELLTLVDEFNRVSEQANFNGTHLLDGTLSNLQLQVGLNKGETIDMSLEDSRGSAIFTTVSTVGTGTFAHAQTLTRSFAPVFVDYLGDIDNDGDQDFGLNDWDTGNYILYRREDSGEFSTEDLGNYLIDFDDVNGDGLKDYFAMNATDWSIHLQRADGTFYVSQSVSSLLSGARTLRDFDGDGDLDLVHDSDLTVGVLLNNGDGQFDTSIPEFGGLAGTIDQDINGDRILDVLEIDGVNHIVRYRLGNINGTFGNIQTLDVGVNYTSIRLGDFNGDGIKDVVALHNSNGSAVIRMGSSSGAFGTGQTQASAANYSSLWETQDVNSDGYDDLFFLNDTTDSVAVRLSDGAGGFTKGQTLSITGGYADATYTIADHFADLDGDGNIDLISTKPNGHAILWGDGAGGFANQQTLDLGNSFTFSFQDLNNDGLLDLVGNIDAFPSSATPAQYFLNQGDRSFTYSQLTSPTLNAAVILNDFNGDGISDYMLAQDFNPDFAIYTQNTEVLENALTISMRSQEEAQNLLGVFDRAIEKLNARRANIGATTSRLESALANTQMTLENLSSAKSQILDVDIASETAELTRLQILQQAQASVLSQANSSLQMVLELLRFRS